MLSLSVLNTLALASSPKAFEISVTNESKISLFVSPVVDTEIVSVLSPMVNVTDPSPKPAKSVPEATLLVSRAMSRCANR